MDEQAEPTSAPQSGQHADPQADPHAGIDVEQLAERVYRLFLAEARLAHARGEQMGRRRKQ
jgi:hypothetical protein